MVKGAKYSVADKATSSEVYNDGIGMTLLLLMYILKELAARKGVTSFDCLAAKLEQQSFNLATSFE